VRDLDALTAAETESAVGTVFEIAYEAVFA